MIIFIILIGIVLWYIIKNAIKKAERQRRERERQEELERERSVRSRFPLAVKRYKYWKNKTDAEWNQLEQKEKYRIEKYRVIESSYPNALKKYFNPFRYPIKFKSYNYDALSDSEIDAVLGRRTWAKEEKEILIDNKYNKIRADVIAEYKRIHPQASKEEIVNDESEINRIQKLLDAIEKQFQEFKASYPFGVSKYQELHPRISKLEIINNKDEIIELQKKHEDIISIEEWQTKQSDFASFCRTLRNSELPNSGCYPYSAQVSYKDYQDKLCKKDFKVWNIFENSTCLDETLDYTHFQNHVQTRNNIKEFKARTRYYYESVYDRIAQYIKKLKEKYIEEDVLVLYGSSETSGIRSIQLFNEYHFSHLIEVLRSEDGISTSTFNGEMRELDGFEGIVVVVDFFSHNEKMVELCSNIFDHDSNRKIRIAYLSLIKFYDSNEMQEIIDNKNREIKEKEEAERRRKEEEEQRRREEEERKRREQAEKQLLIQKVSGWGRLGCGLPYNYLLNYYPITCDFEVNDDIWADRWTVWNFKNTPGKTSSLKHEEALNNVVPRLKRKLENTFGSSLLSKLTLVCIPASSAEKTRVRYEDFSQRLCRQTGMTNAYNYMKVVSSSQEKKFGGSGITTNNVSFDSDFFKGKYVVLFDDVITKGDSMSRFKSMMESLGAIVVCGLSIGKTTHHIE